MGDNGLVLRLKTSRRLRQCSAEAGGGRDGAGRGGPDGEGLGTPRWRALSARSCPDWALSGRVTPLDEIKKDPVWILGPVVIVPLLREKSYVDDKKWPPDSPLAGVYDVRNTSAKLVIYNNRRPSTTNRLRGYSAQTQPREPSPQRHLPKIGKDSPESSGKQRQHSAAASVQTRTSGVSSAKRSVVEDDPYLHLNGPVREKQVLDRKRAQAQALAQAPALDFTPPKDLSQADRKYLATIAATYDLTETRAYREERRRRMLQKQARQGYPSAAQYEKTIRNKKTAVPPSSTRRQSAPLLARRRAIQAGAPVSPRETPVPVKQDEPEPQPTSNKIDMAFLQSVTDEAQDPQTTSAEVTDRSDGGQTVRLAPRPPPTSREGTSRPRSRLGRARVKHDEEPQESIPSDKDSNSNNSLVVIIDNDEGSKEQVTDAVMSDVTMEKEEKKSPQSELVDEAVQSPKDEEEEGKQEKEEKQEVQRIEDQNQATSEGNSLSNEQIQESPQPDADAIEKPDEASTPRELLNEVPPDAQDNEQEPPSQPVVDCPDLPAASAEVDFQETPAVVDVPAEDTKETEEETQKAATENEQPAEAVLHPDGLVESVKEGAAEETEDLERQDSELVHPEVKEQAVVDVKEEEENKEFEDMVDVKKEEEKEAEVVSDDKEDANHAPPADSQVQLDQDQQAEKAEEPQEVQGTSEETNQEETVEASNSQREGNELMVESQDVQASLVSLNMEQTDERMKEENPPEPVGSVGSTEILIAPPAISFSNLQEAARDNEDEDSDTEELKPEKEPEQEESNPTVNSTQEEEQEEHKVSTVVSDVVRGDSDVQEEAPTEAEAEEKAAEEEREQDKGDDEGEAEEWVESEDVVEEQVEEHVMGTLMRVMGEMISSQSQLETTSDGMVSGQSHSASTTGDMVSSQPHFEPTSGDVVSGQSESEPAVPSAISNQSLPGPAAFAEDKGEDEGEARGASVIERTTEEAAQEAERECTPSEGLKLEEPALEAMAEGKLVEEGVTNASQATADEQIEEKVENIMSNSVGENQEEKLVEEALGDTEPILDKQEEQSDHLGTIGRANQDAIAESLPSEGREEDSTAIVKETGCQAEKEQLEERDGDGTEDQTQNREEETSPSLVVQDDKAVQEVVHPEAEAEAFNNEDRERQNEEQKDVKFVAEEVTEVAQRVVDQVLEESVAKYNAVGDAVQVVASSEMDVSREGENIENDGEKTVPESDSKASVAASAFQEDNERNLKVIPDGQRETMKGAEEEAGGSKAEERGADGKQTGVNDESIDGAAEGEQIGMEATKVVHSAGNTEQEEQVSKDEVKEKDTTSKEPNEATMEEVKAVEIVSSQVQLADHDTESGTIDQQQPNTENVKKNVDSSSNEAKDKDGQENKKSGAEEKSEEEGASEPIVEGAATVIADPNGQALQESQEPSQKDGGNSPRGANEISPDELERRLKQLRAPALPHWQTNGMQEAGDQATDRGQHEVGPDGMNAGSQDEIDTTKISSDTMMTDNEDAIEQNAERSVLEEADINLENAKEEEKAFDNVGIEKLATEGVKVPASVNSHQLPDTAQPHDITLDKEQLDENKEKGEEAITGKEKDLIHTSAQDMGVQKTMESGKDTDVISSGHNAEVLVEADVHNGFGVSSQQDINGKSFDKSTEGDTVFPSQNTKENIVGLAEKTDENLENKTTMNGEAGSDKRLDAEVTERTTGDGNETKSAVIHDAQSNEHPADVVKVSKEVDIA